MTPPISVAVTVAVAVVLTRMDFAQSKITFPKVADAETGSDVLQPMDASLLLGLKSLESVTEIRNAVISPASLYTCLWLLCMGARGDTKYELKHVLGAFTKASMTAELNALQDVSAANAAFVDASVPVKYEYVMALKNNIFSVNFTDDTPTRQTINGWVSSQTNGSIPNLLDSPLDGSTKAIVISALYFNATWLHPFDPQITKIGRFEISPNKLREVSLMIRYASFPLYRGPTYDALGLPYKDNGFTLFIVLPHARGSAGLKSLLHHLSPEEVNHLATAAEDTPLIATIPRFVADHKMQLRPVLQSLGINKMFDPQFADFGDLVDQDGLSQKVYVSDLVQSVHLEVDEKGSRGGAATTAFLTKSGKTTFVANRPFVYLLRHTTGHVLFLGAFTRPATSSTAQS